MCPRNRRDKVRTTRPGFLTRVSRRLGIWRFARLDEAHLPDRRYRPEWDVKGGKSPRMHYIKAQKMTERLLRENPRLRELKEIWSEYQKTGNPVAGMDRLKTFIERVRGDGLRVEMVPEGHVEEGLVHIDPKKGRLAGTARDYAKARNQGTVLGDGIYIEKPIRSEGFERFFRTFAHEYGTYILRNIFRGKRNIPHYGDTYLYITHYLDESLMPPKKE